MIDKIKYLPAQVNTQVLRPIVADSTAAHRAIEQQYEKTVVLPTTHQGTIVTNIKLPTSVMLPNEYNEISDNPITTPIKELSIIPQKTQQNFISPPKYQNLSVQVQNVQPINRSVIVNRVVPVTVAQPFGQIYNIPQNVSIAPQFSFVLNNQMYPIQPNIMMPNTFLLIK